MGQTHLNTGLIRKVMKRKALRIEDLAVMATVSERTLKRVLAGESVSAVTVRRLARALGTEPEMLAKGAEWEEEG